MVEYWCCRVVATELEVGRMSPVDVAPLRAGVRMGLYILGPEGEVLDPLSDWPSHEQALVACQREALRTGRTYITCVNADVDTAAARAAILRRELG